MKSIISFFLIIFVLQGITSISRAIENKILFKVDNEIITSLDILNEIKYLTLINDNFTKLNKIESFEIAKKSLLREKIKEIDINKFFKNIEISDQNFNTVISSSFSRLGVSSKKEFNDFFMRENLDPNIIKQKITIEILWNQMIYQKFQNKVKISKDEIKDKLLKNKMQKEYLLFEILFNIDENENINKKYEVILNDIKEKGFEQAALTHSISKTNNSGGKLGWIKDSVLSSKIKTEISKIDNGKVTLPIVVPGGFVILKMKDSREIEREIDIESEVELVFKEKVNEQLNQFSNIYFNKVKKDIVINEF